MNKIKCPCCHYKTIEEEWDICPVCFWENDDYQLTHPCFPVGANHISLIEAQMNYLEFGACEEYLKQYVRLPFKDE